jgi:hypothetical protein
MMRCVDGADVLDRHLSVDAVPVQQVDPVGVDPVVDRGEGLPDERTRDRTCCSMY